jgi:hypothetical protein
MKIPEPVTVATVFATGEKVQIPGYTVEQMLAWGKANAEAEREACARLVVGLFDPEDAIAEAIAEAIRARGNT